MDVRPRFVVSALLTALLSACAAGSGPAGNPVSGLDGARPAGHRPAAATYSVLYRFQGGADGANPVGRLVASGAGVLYGATLNGGGSSNCSGGTCGAIFALTPAPGGGYTESILHAFTGPPGGGAFPSGGPVLDGSGNLYGVTQYGGTNNLGAVYEIKFVSGTPSFNLVYSFAGGATDAAYPLGSLVWHAGSLYGVSKAGGTGACAGGCGTIFELSPPGVAPLGRGVRPHSGSWTVTLRYSFTGNAGGAAPAERLLWTHGAFYGETSQGGTSAACCGTIFTINADGTGFRRLYAFKGAPDGSTPTGGLNYATNSSTLVGATSAGGSGGAGTIFTLGPRGPRVVERAVYAPPASGGPAGLSMPVDDRDRFLFSTSASGGANGLGTVFVLVPRGTQYVPQVLYDFAGGTDGANPQAGLTVLNNTYYGSTSNGGGSSNCTNGCGTVYSLHQ